MNYILLSVVGVVLTVVSAWFVVWQIKRAERLKYDLEAVETRDRIESEAKKIHNVIDANTVRKRERARQWLRAYLEMANSPADKSMH